MAEMTEMTISIKKFVGYCQYVVLIGGISLEARWRGVLWAGWTGWAWIPNSDTCLGRH